jgi:putative phosphoesterase
MKIGVLSDTHAYSSAELPREIIKVLSEVDLIVHTGDFVGIEVLKYLKQLGEVKAVRGNMDIADVRKALPQKEMIVIGGKKVGIIHGSGSPWGIAHRIREEFDQVDVIIYGHTHIAKNEVINGVLFFNPGEGRHSFGILEIDREIKGEIIRIEH